MHSNLKGNILILGGHERMEREYKLMMKEKGYKSKIYTIMPSGLRKRIGNPDAIVLFMSTISHKMVDTVLKDARKKNIPIIKVQNSSKQAFIECLDNLDSCNKDCDNCVYRSNIQ